MWAPKICAGPRKIAGSAFSGGVMKGDWIYIAVILLLLAVLLADYAQ